MSSQSNDYLSKYAELDALVRKHASHKDRKCKSVETQLQDAMYENQLLQERVVMLTGLLDRERNASKHLLQTYEQTTAAEHKDLFERQRKLLSEEQAFENRLRQLQEKEAYLSDFEAQLRRLHEELSGKSDSLKKKEEEFLHGINVMQGELDEEQQRTALASAEAEEKLQEALHASEAAQQRRHDLDLLYTVERRHLSLLATEMHDRMCITNAETDSRSALLSGAFRVVWGEIQEAMRQREEADAAQRTRADLLELKARELAARFRREQDCLRDDIERLSLEKESFLLDCQAIARNIRAALTTTTCSTTANGCLKALERAETMLSAASRLSYPEGLFIQPVDEG